MEITGIITALVVGLIIGALGRLVAPGKQNIPIWLTLVIGVVAALIGTALASALGFAATPGIDWLELILQVGPRRRWGHHHCRHLLPPRHPHPLNKLAPALTCNCGVA